MGLGQSPAGLHEELSFQTLNCHDDNLSLRQFVTVMKQAEFSCGLSKYMLGNREEIDGFKH